jgi:hypothetical protein
LDRAFSSTSRLGFYNQGLPPQTVSVKEKQSEEWIQGCMRFMLNEARMHSKQKVDDLKKFKMLSDQYDYSDNHKWMLDPLNLGKDMEELYGAVDPIQHYPIINTPLNTILGERIGRTTQFFCVSEAPESRNEYYRQKGDMLFDQVHGTIMNNVAGELLREAQQSGQPIDQEVLQKIQQQAMQNMPPSVQDYMDTDYVDVTEKVHNRIIKSLMRRNDLETEFIEGFRIGTICGKEFYSFDVVNDKLKIRNLSNFAVFYHKSASARWISESQFAGYRLFLTPSSIIDTCRDYLTLDDINRLEQKLNPATKAGGVNSLTGIKSISYDTSVFADWHGNTFDNLNTSVVSSMIDEFQLTGRSSWNRSSFGLFEMVKAYWKTYRKVGVLEFFVEGDPIPQKTLVDEFYAPDTNAGEHVKWYYLNQVYQGTVIADDTILDVRPYPHQIFDENDPDYSPLPIEGTEYNNYNGQTMSLVDLMLPWAELYDITAHELKKDMKKALGKALFMSVDHIPDIPGFDMNRWMYWLKEFGIAWVGQGKAKSTFSHFSAQDMSFGEQMVAKMNMLDRIKMNCDSFAGFSQPRVAGTHNAPTQGQDQQKLESSFNQTEFWFWKHSKICERVLTLGLNIEKRLVKKRQDYTVLYDDLEQRYIDADLDKATAENCGVYVINATKEITKREALRQMAAAAAGKNGVPEDMADIIIADTINEVNKVLKSMKRKREEAQQQQQQMEQAQMQQQKQMADEALAWEKEKLYATLQSEERQEYIRSFINQEDNLKDTDLDQMPDILEQDKLFELSADNQRKHQREMRKMDMEKAIKDKELSIKDKEVAVKKEKNQIDLKNQANDLAIEKQRSRNRAPKK